MRPRQWFIILLAGSLFVILSITLSYAAAYRSDSISMQNMMRQMMGEGSYSGEASMSMMSPYFWSLLIAFIGLITAGVMGLTYYAIFPEIKLSPLSGAGHQSVASKIEYQKQSWSTMLLASKPEEKMVLEALANHNGAYMQKLIVKETGLSRLKVHRIISRFAERNVVNVVRSGNSNNVSLADWVKQDLPKVQTSQQ